MAYEVVSDDPVAFNSADEKDDVILIDNSAQSKTSQQLLDNSKSKYNSKNHSTNPNAQNTNMNDSIALAFSGMPRSSTANMNLSKPSGSGSRLLLKKSIDKANESSIEQTSLINKSTTITKANTHINNIEELDKDPPNHNDGNTKPNYPIPPIPARQNASTTISPTNNSNQLSILNTPSTQSVSQGSSSFELFTKMPPVPVPPQQNDINQAESSSTQNPSPPDSKSGRIAVQIKPKFLQKKTSPNAAAQQSNPNTTQTSTRVISAESVLQQNEKKDSPRQGMIPVKIKPRTASTKQSNVNTPSANQISQISQLDEVQSPKPTNNIDQKPSPVSLHEEIIQNNADQQNNSSPSNQNQQPINTQGFRSEPILDNDLAHMLQNQQPEQAQPIQNISVPQTVQQPIQQPTKQIQQPIQQPIQQNIQQPSLYSQQQLNQNNGIPLSQNTQSFNQDPVQPMDTNPRDLPPILQTTQHTYHIENAINGIPTNLSQHPELLSNQMNANSMLHHQQQILQQLPPSFLSQHQEQYPISSNSPTGMYPNTSISPASYTDHSAPRLSPIYAQATLPNQVYVSTPPSIYVKPSPTSAVEKRFSASLDRSITSLRRYFSSEFSMIMRQMSSPSMQQGLASTNGTGIDFDFDDYSQTVSHEVSKLIESPIAPLDVNYSQLSKQIGQVIDNQTKPLSSVLSESNAKQKSLEQLRLSELNQLKQELESLQNIIQTNADGILKELEKERQNSATLNKAHIAKQNEIDQRLRAVKLKQVELETQSSHQNIERETLEKQLKQLENRRREWEDKFHGYGRESQDGFYGGDDSFLENFDSADPYSTGRLRQQIIDEINDLRKQFDHDAFDEMTRNIQDGISAIRSESDNMRTELVDIDMANMWVMSQIQTLQNRNSSISLVQYQPNTSTIAQTFIGNTLFPPSPVKSQKNRDASSPISKAQIKLDHFRKQRQEVVRKVQDEM